jgi:hypothetical protein
MCVRVRSLETLCCSFGVLELEAAHLAGVSARRRKCVLRVRGTVNGIDSIGEVGQDTIPSRIGYSSAMFSNQLVMIAR